MPESRSTTSATTTVTLSGAPARMASSTSRSAVRPGGLARREDLLDGVPRDEAGQPVGAEEEPVPGTGLAHHEVGLVAIAAGQDPGDEGTLRVAVGLGLGDAALVDQRLHERVVVGDLREGLAAQEVGARVADVGQGDLVAGAQEGGDGGAHALQLGTVLDPGLDLGVGGRERAAEVVGRVVPAVALAVEGDHRADRDGARDVAARVAAHPVGDDEEVRPGIPGVLVLRAHQAHVGAGSVVERDLHGACPSVPQLDDSLADAQHAASLDRHGRGEFL